MSGNDGIIAWGTGISASGAETVHFILGIPTLASDLATLAINNPIGTYTLIGGTAPTFRDSNGTITGTLDSASLKANFASMLVDASVTTKFNTATGTMTLTGTSTGMSISTFSGSSFTSFCSSNNCTITGGGSCSVNMQGFFAGPNAIRAGLVYGMGTSIPTAGTFTNGSVIGAVAFAKK